MLIIKLYCSVIADFFGASRKDKVVAGVMSMFLCRTSLDPVKPVLTYCGIKELIDRLENETLAIFDGDGCICGGFSVFYLNCFLYCDSSIQINSKHFLFLYQSLRYRGRTSFPRGNEWFG